MQYFPDKLIDLIDKRFEDDFVFYSEIPGRLVYLLGCLSATGMMLPSGEFSLWELLLCFPFIGIIGAPILAVFGLFSVVSMYVLYVFWMILKAIIVPERMLSDTL